MHRLGEWSWKAGSGRWGMVRGLRASVAAGLLLLGGALLATSLPGGIGGWQSPDALLLLTLLVAAPLAEELFFRTVLHEALLGWRPSVAGRFATVGWAAVVNGVVASAFALLHAATRGVWLGAAVWLPAWLIGIQYGRRRRLIDAVLLHAGFNALWWGGRQWFEG